MESSCSGSCGGSHCICGGCGGESDTSDCGICVTGNDEVQGPPALVSPMPPSRVIPMPPSLVIPVPPSLASPMPPSLVDAIPPALVSPMSPALVSAMSSSLVSPMPPIGESFRRGDRLKGSGNSCKAGGVPCASKLSC